MHLSRVSHPNVFFSESNSVGTLAFPCVDGCYLPKQENVFVHTVLDELDAFQQRDDQKSVLLFPPLPSRLRYLIHRTVENHLNLSTFSVGEGWCRRVVVCFSHLRLPSEDDSDTDSSAYEAPPSRYDQPMESSRAGEGLSERRHSRGRGARRPDQAIYVPRALRERSGGGGDQQGVTTSSPAERAESVSSTLSLSTSDTSESCSDSAAANQHPALDPLDESGGQELFVQLSGSDPCPWPPAWDQTVSYFVSMSLDDQVDEEQEEEEEEDASVRSSSSTGAPPSIASSSTESTAGNLTHEILAKLTEEDIGIEPVQHDYSSFENVWLNEEDFSHVIEIYDFPAMFKTDDLMDAFSDYSGGGMKIKWVDNTHALGVFSNETAAAQALSIRHPLLKTRPLSKASKKSKGKAVRRAEFIQPVKERPRTDTAAARRMVTRALGLQRGGTRGKRF
ncbi:hypothetical protein AALO_G00164310 [Alosa alosa]|uniref:R3H domain-containing protein n=1 Tax=Alosa alosa TaxID=278164 RepID=A0AAV6GCR6_9TELE|nr:hypothetical protein AALO_G00164310 [Alosa alosa]